MLLLAGCSPKESLEDSLRASEARISAHQFQAALIELKNAARNYPQAPVPRLRLAQLYSRFGDGNAARIEIEKALALGLPATEAAPIQIQSKILSGKPADAIQSIEAIPTFRESAELLTMYGYALTSQAQNDQAKAMFDAALAREPANGLALVGLAGLVNKKNDYKTALELANSAIASDPENYVVRMFRAELLLKSEASAAVREFDLAQKLNPFSVAPAIGKARGLLAGSDFQNAEVILTGARKRFPNSIAVVYYLGATNLYLNQADTAIELFREVLSKSPHHSLSQYYLGLLLFRKGQYEQAEDYVSTFLRAFPRYQPGRKLLASIQLKRNKSKEALATLTSELSEPDQDPEFLALQAGIYFADNNAELGIDALRKAAALAPNDAKIKSALILTELKAGHGAEATETLIQEIALGRDVATNSMLLLYRHLHANAWQDAITLGHQLLEKNENPSAVHNALGIAYSSSGQSAEARREFELAAKAATDPAPFLRNLVQVHLAAKDYSAANDVVSKLLSEKPDSPFDLTLAGRVALAQAKRDEAFNFYTRAVQSGARAPEPLTYIALHHLQAGSFREAATAAGAGLALVPNDERLLLTFADASLRAGDLENAATAAESAARLYPSNVQALLFAANARLNQGQKPLAAAHLDKARALAPENPDVLSAAASLAASNNDSANAESAVDSLARIEGESARVYIQRGNLARLNGDLEKALLAYQKAASIDESSTTLELLGNALFEVGRGSEAVTLYDSMNKKYPKDIQPQLNLAYALERLDRKGEAIKAYRAALEIDKNALAALNNLALLLSSDAPREALELAERAYKIKPSDARVEATLGWAAMYANQPERSLELLSSAIAREPELGEIHYRYGVALARNGNSPQAIKQLSRALQDRELQSREQAQALLDSLRR